MSIAGQGAIAALFLGGCGKEQRPASSPKKEKPETASARQLPAPTQRESARKETDRIGGLLAPTTHGGEGPAGDDVDGGDLASLDRELPPRRAVMKRKMPVAVGGKGSIDLREAHSTVWDHKDELTKCYEAGIAQDKGLSGKITPRLKIGEKGRVVRAEATVNELGPTVEKCLLKEMGKIRFPRPEGGVVEVEFPMMFVQI